MEFVEGVTLKQRVKAGGPLAEAEAVALGRKVASALKAAHDLGIVHRDVKPENILLRPDGEPKLADLGLAKPMSGEADVTQGGLALGTPMFMAPEQAKGEAVDGRADLYALGATLFSALTGRPLFEGHTAAAIQIKHATEPPPPIRTLRPDLSPGLEAVLLRLLQKSPDDRHADAAALIADLDLLAAGKAPATRSPRATVRRRAAPPPRRLGLLLAVAAGLLVIGVAVIVVARPSPPAPPPATPAPAVPPTPPVVVTTRPVEPAPPPVPPDQAAREMLAFARRFAAGNPDQSAKAAEYFTQAKKAGAGTVVAMEADQELLRLEQVRQAADRQAWEQVSAQAQARAAAGDYDAALAAIREAQASGRRFGPLPDDLSRSLIEQAERQARDEITRSRQALEAGDLATAAAAAGRARAVGCAPLRQRLSADLASLDAALAAAEAQRTTAAQAAWDAAAPALLDELCAGRTTAVRERVRSLAQDPALAAASTRLPAVTAVADAFDRRQAALVEGMKARIGQPVQLRTASRTVSGILTQVDDQVLKVEFVMPAPGGGPQVRGTTPVKWTEMQEEQLAELQAVWRPATPDEQMAAACAALGAGRSAEAASALALAALHPLASAAQARLRVVQVGAVEAAAEAAWKALAAQAAGTPTPQRCEALLQELSAWRAAHGGSRFAGDHAAEIQALAARLAARPAAAGVGLLRNGGFEQGLEAWVPLPNGEPPEVVEKVGVNGSRALRLEALEGRRGRCGLTQALRLEPGRDYQLTLQARSDGPGGDVMARCMVVARDAAVDAQRVEPGEEARPLARENLRCSRLAAQGGWQALVLPFTATTTEVVLDLHVVPSRKDTGAILVDDIQVTLLPPGMPPPPRRDG